VPHVTCRKCGAENISASVVCHQCAAPLTRSEHRGDSSFVPPVELNKTFIACWLGAAVVALTLALVRHPSLGVWSDIGVAAAVTLLLVIGFHLPFLAGNLDLSVGGVAALSSSMALRFSEAGLVISLLAGLGVGVVFGVAMAFAMPRFQKKSWRATGLAAMVALAGACLLGARTPLGAAWLSDNDIGRIIFMAAPAVIALIGLYVVIYHTPLGNRLLDLRLPVSDASDLRSIRVAYLISGTLSGLAGACAGVLMGIGGATNAAMFALSPLALVLLTGASLNRRLFRLENLIPATFIYSGLIFLLGMPAWSSVGQGSSLIWHRMSGLTSIADGMVGLGLSLNLVILLLCRDLLLSAVNVVGSRGVESVHYTGAGRRSGLRRTATNRQALQWVGALAMSLLLGLSLTAYSTAFHSDGTSTTAMLHSATGDVRMQPSGGTGWTAASEKDTLDVGTAIRTGDSSHAVIRMPGRNAVRLDPNSEMVVRSLSDPKANRHETRLFLLVGRLWTDVRERLGGTDDSQFQVQTPSAVGAVRGTQFSARSQHGESAFSVNKGFVEVSTGDAAVLVNDGQKVIATRGVGVTKPARMTAEDLVLWRQHEGELDDALALYSRKNVRDFSFGILGLLAIMGIFAETIYGRGRNSL